MKIACPWHARLTVAALAVCGVLAAGCAPGVSPSRAPASATDDASTRSASTAPSQAESSTREVIAGPVRLTVPASWRTRSALPNPSGNRTVAFLGPIALPSECADTPGGGGVCHPWPIVRLANGDIVVAVRDHGMPGSRPPDGGEAITVAELSARRSIGPADEGCRAIGGTESIGVTLPRGAGTTGWLSLDACLVGPETVTVEAAFAAVLESVTLAPDGASPTR